MPKSKRSEIVSLTHARKKGRERKETLFESIRACVEQYQRLFVFDVRNTRQRDMKQLRHEWQDSSRFFLGKNKVMQIALGKSQQDEFKKNLHLVGGHLTNICGLLFTNKTQEEVVNFFSKYQVDDFAKSGFVVDQEVSVDEGPLPQFPHSMEQYLRKLGLPVMLKDGEIQLAQRFTICKAGDTLTPEQAKLLKLMDIKLSKFKILLKCIWSRDTCEFSLL